MRDIAEKFTGQVQKSTYLEEDRAGAPFCHDSDSRKIRPHDPKWNLTKSLETARVEIVPAGAQRTAG